MATLKQSGAQSATYFTKDVVSVTLAAADWAALPSGRLKSFLTAAYADRLTMVEAWAAVGGSIVLSGATTDGAIIAMSLDGDDKPQITVSNLTDEELGHVIRISASYSASE